jgi:FKBP-type peptidyl-prolyl cis-trans isomerase
MRPTFCLALILALGLLASCTPASDAGGQPQADAALETDDAKILYALGQILGGNVADSGLSEEDLGPMWNGFSDSVLGRDAQVDMDTYGPMVSGFMQLRIAAVADAELEEANAFLEQRAALDGTVLTDSGIVIQEISAGTGAQPTAEDIVSVHYHGTLRDGSVFDSSVDRGEPVDFPLGQVIPCWTEGLQTMMVGGESVLTCPPGLAYGANPPPGIPPNAALVFEVELLEIVELEEEPPGIDE